LGHPIVADVGFLLRNPKYCNSSQKQWVDALRHYPVSIAFAHECIDSVTEEMKVLGRDLLEVETLHYKGKTYNLRFAVLTGDNSAVNKMIGNSCGGSFRCPHCTANFDNFQQLWSYAHLKKCKSKTLLTVREMLNDPNSGIVRPCGIFSACQTEEERERITEIV